MNLRFTVKDTEGKVLEITDWMEEHSREVAVSAVQDLRRLHGQEARISVERDAAPQDKAPTQVRFKIDEGHDRTLYSKVFPISEREERLTEMKEKFPKAQIIVQEIR